MRRTERSEPPTSRITAAFSATVSRTYRPPSRSPSDFFQQPILKRRLGQCLLEPRILLAQPLHQTRPRRCRTFALSLSRSARRGLTPLACLQASTTRAYAPSRYPS